MNKRDDSIDICKGIGVFLVIVAHSIIWSGQYQFLARLIYSFHMPLFFFLSGAVISSQRSSFNLIKARVVKFVPLLLLSALIVFLFRFLIYNNDIFLSIQHFKIRLFKNSGDLWFLWAILVSHTVVILLRQCKIAAILILLTAFVAYYFQRIIPIKYGYIYQGLIVSPFVYLGYLYAQNKWYKNNLSIYILPAIFLLLITAFLPRALFTHVGIIPYGLLSIGGALAGIYLTIIYSKSLNTNNTIVKFFIWSGKLSLVILFIHHLENHIFLPYLATKIHLSIYTTLIIRLIFVYCLVYLIYRVQKYHANKKGEEK